MNTTAHYLAALPPGPVSPQQVQQLVAQLLGEAEREKRLYAQLLIRAVLRARDEPKQPMHGLS